MELLRAYAALRLNREFRVRNSIAYGWQVARRTATLQIGTTVAAAVVASGFGWHTGLAALVGGGIVSVGNLLFALRLFGRGVVSARVALRSAWAAELLKWLWLCATLFVAIAVWKLSFAGLITGILAAQFAFWIALPATR